MSENDNNISSDKLDSSKKVSSDKKLRKDGTFSQNYLGTLTQDQLFALKAETKGDPLKEGSVDIELSKRLSQYKHGEEPPIELFKGTLRYRDAWKSWHSREFVLTLEKLNYYKVENGTRHAVPEGFMNLSGCAVNNRDSKKEAFCFKITHPSAKAHRGARMNYDYLILASDSSEDRALWIAALETAIIFASADPAKKTLSLSQSPSTTNTPNAPEDSGSESHVDEVARSTTPPIKSSKSTTIIDEKKKLKKRVSQLDSALKKSKSTKNVEEAILGESVEGVFTDADDVDEPQPTPYIVDKPLGVTSTGTGAAEEELGSESKSLILSLIKQVRPGMDLSKVVLPTFILEPRSMLEKLTDFMSHSEVLISAPKLNDPLERLLAVVKFYVSAFYIKPDGVKKPYNPIIGETFRCRWEYPDGSRTHYIAEQVSHHPPISSFYAQNRAAGIIIDGSILFGSKFMGTYAASMLNGYATVHFTEHGEKYKFTFPDAHAKGFIVGPLVMELVGLITISCEETGYRAELDFRSKPFFGGDYNVVSGKIKRDKETLYTISGHWDDKFVLTDSQTKQKQTLWDSAGKERLLKWKPPMEKMEEKESDRLWAKVGQAIVAKDQVAATEEKHVLEQAQRELHKQLKETNTEWVPRWFEKSDEDDRYYYKWLDDGMRPWDPTTERVEYESFGRIFSEPVTQVVKSKKRRDRKNTSTSLEKSSSTSSPISTRKSKGSSIRSSNNTVATVSTATNSTSTRNSSQSTAVSARDQAVVSALQRRVATLEAKLATIDRQKNNVVNGPAWDNQTSRLVLIVIALYLVSSFNLLGVIFG